MARHQVPRSAQRSTRGCKWYANIAYDNSSFGFDHGEEVTMRIKFNTIHHFCLFVLIVSSTIALSACREKAPEASASAKRFDIKGKVVSADQANHKVTIDHEAITGYMDAMTMPFTLLDDWAYPELTPG